MTARRADIAIPGIAPLYLTREQAAWFVGVSPNLFDAEVAAGRWPKGIVRGERGGRLTWYRPDLEAAAARHDALFRSEQDGGQAFDAWRDRLPKGRQDRKEAPR